MHQKSLHVFHVEKFTTPFIELIEQEFDISNHYFWVTGKDQPLLEVAEKKYVERIKGNKLAQLKGYFSFIRRAHKAEKIILHSLFNMKIVFILFFMPWLLKKCYWVVWGGDLYCYETAERNWRFKRRELFRRAVIKNIGHLVTYIKGDVDLARNWYGAKGKYIECLMYTSNIYKNYDLPKKNNEILTVLVGNSAVPTNNHSEILQKLAQFKDKSIKVITPLSYGDKDYAQQVIKEGKKLLGDKYQALTDFMPFEDYLKVLAEVDVAIFNHKRQQAMGNTITLLGLGKEVYIRSDVAQWELFKELGVKVNDIFELGNTLLDKTDETNLVNKSIVQRYFSKENLVRQLKSYLD